ncbi:MAG: dephospho-CoA kinase [Acidimicrobiales bacterium]|jgi:dephospho-CoA kinase
MLGVALTGGIGSGKSAVAGLMVDRGAVLIDADSIAREVVEPEGPAYQPLIERFGSRILAPDATLDRKALAALVFADAKKVAALNRITHPAVAAVMIERCRAHQGTDRVVLMDIPLFYPLHREILSIDVVVVVDCPVELAVERLVEQRGFDRADAQARVSAQVGRAERIAGADIVIDNSADREALASQVEKVWAQLVDLEHAKSNRGDRGR